MWFFLVQPSPLFSDRSHLGALFKVFEGDSRVSRAALSTETSHPQGPVSSSLVDLTAPTVQRSMKKVCRLGKPGQSFVTFCWVTCIQLCTGRRARTTFPGPCLKDGKYFKLRICWFSFMAGYVATLQHSCGFPTGEKYFCLRLAGPPWRLQC